jgi:hypothetical protein
VGGFRSRTKVTELLIILIPNCLCYTQSNGSAWTESSWVHLGGNNIKLYENGTQDWSNTKPVVANTQAFLKIGQTKKKR